MNMEQFLYKSTIAINLNFFFLIFFLGVANGSIYYECMKLAVGQCAVVRSAALQSTASFVASWLSPSVYLTIKVMNGLFGSQYYVFI